MSKLNLSVGEPREGETYAESPTPDFNMGAYGKVNDKGEFTPRVVVMITVVKKGLLETILETNRWNLDPKKVSIDQAITGWISKGGLLMRARPKSQLDALRPVDIPLGFCDMEKMETYPKNLVIQPVLHGEGAEFLKVAFVSPLGIGFQLEMTPEGGVSIHHLYFNTRETMPCPK